MCATCFDRDALYIPHQAFHVLVYFFHVVFGVILNTIKYEPPGSQNTNNTNKNVTSGTTTTNKNINNKVTKTKQNIIIG